MKIRLLLALGPLLAALPLTTGHVVASPAPTLTPPAASSQDNLPSGLPGTFWMGLGNQPGELDWMRTSGVPWNARYQYLTGGVNTGTGWATWWPGNGGFALDYMKASRAAGIMPVFTYYQLMYSLPHQGAYESDWDYNTLNTPSTMLAYYQEFALLLQRCAEFGGPVLIHVEPDFWGYMEQRAHNGSNDAADISAAVAKSGDPALAGYPDTLQGFALALLHLRDTLAPNALLAIHASSWGSGADFSTSRDPALDPAALGQATGRFLATAGILDNPPGVSHWDLVFTDPSDRDADWYRLMANDGGSHWWDMSDTTLPNFAHYRAWLAALNAATGLRIVLWQVPIGNNVAPIENNSPAHYQDNRTVYFLGDSGAHLRDWINAGLVGILWGRGNDQSTTYTDDGNYLRDQAAAYYRRGALPLPATLRGAGPALTPTPEPIAPTLGAPPSVLPGPSKGGGAGYKLR